MINNPNLLPIPYYLLLKKHGYFNWNYQRE
jgi:hypothetical protein